MALHYKTKLREHPKAKTQYFTIPALVVKDSQYPFKDKDRLEAFVDPEKKAMFLKKVP